VNSLQRYTLQMICTRINRVVKRPHIRVSNAQPTVSSAYMISVNSSKICFIGQGDKLFTSPIS